ncbi:FGFR1 oncogene partner 2 homolog [Symsagittifera roscoffensis]
MAVATAPGCASSNPGMNVSFGVSGNNIPRSSSPNNNGGNNASCTIQSLLQTAKKLAERLNEHETNVESIITQTQELNKHMVSMKTYKDEVDGINENNRPRPQLNNSRRQLIKGIQYENRQIKTLQRENEELKQALEEHQNAMELIMSKYREHVSTLSQYAKLDLTTFNAAVNQREIEQKNAKIMEMVSVMQQVVRLDESSAYAAEKKIAELEYQNKTLRELLKVSQDFKSRILLASAAEPHTAASPVNSGGGPDTAGIVQGDDPNSNNSSRSTDENNSEGEDADVSSPNADLMFEYPSRTVKKRPSLG